MSAYVSNRGVSLVRAIKRIPAQQPDKSVLIAIGLERDGRGNYRVKSFYRITAKRLNEFRAKGTVKAART